MPRVRIGLFGVGLDTYWPQFEGLRRRLVGYQRRIAAEIRGFGAEVVDAGLVDNPVSAREAGSLFRREEVEFVVLYVSTYALSSTVLPVVQHVGKPVVVLNLQPVAIPPGIRIPISQFMTATALPGIAPSSANDSTGSVASHDSLTRTGGLSSSSWQETTIDADRQSSSRSLS